MRRKYLILFSIVIFIFLLKEGSAALPEGDIDVRFSIKNWTSGNSSWKNNKWYCNEGIDEYKTYGGLLELWGLSGLTGANFSDSTFQVAINSTILVLTTLRADNIQVRLYYNPITFNVTLVPPTPANNSIIGSTLYVSANASINASLYFLDNCFLQTNKNGSYVNETMTITGATTCSITLTGISNSTFNYSVIASYTDYDTHIITNGISETRNVSVRNVPSLINLISIANNSITTNTSILLNWTVNNTQNDQVIVKGHISRNTTANISNQIFYLNEGNLNGSYTYNLTSMLTPLNSTDLWALYHFDNDIDYGENLIKVYDHSGHNRNGSFPGAGGGNFRVGKFGRGMYHCTGQGSCETKTLNEMRITSSFANISIGGMSINVWINISDLASTQAIVTTLHNAFFRLIQEGSKTDFYIFNNSGTAVVCGANATMGLTANKWYMITATYNKTETRIYKDGVLYGNTTCSFNGTDQAAWQSMTDVVVGEVVTDTSTLVGVIDELAFWNRSLNASEVSDLYNLKNDTYYWYVESNEYNVNNSRVNSSLWQFTLGSFGTCAATNCLYQCSDNCFINSDINCGGNPLLIQNRNGAGYVYFNKTVTNYARRIDIENSCMLGILTPAGMIN